MIYAILAFAAVYLAATSAMAGLYVRESKRASMELLRRGEAELEVARMETRTDRILAKAENEVRIAKAQAAREIMVRKRYYREIEQLEEDARLVGDGAATARGLQRFLSKNADSGEADADPGPVPDWATADSTE